LQNSDVLIPDGIGIVWAIRFLTGQRIQRIPGADLHEHILKIANEQNELQTFTTYKTSPL